MSNWHQGYAKREVELHVAPRSFKLVYTPGSGKCGNCLSGISAVNGCVPAVGRMCFGLGLSQFLVMPLQPHRVWLW